MASEIEVTRTQIKERFTGVELKVFILDAKMKLNWRYRVRRTHVDTFGAGIRVHTEKRMR